MWECVVSHPLFEGSFSAKSPYGILSWAEWNIPSILGARVRKLVDRWESGANPPLELDGVLLRWEDSDTKM